ncbi:hypothetical protein AB0H36_29955 [Kribbella sp. NPDC050820]|uniref:hypothetical protein n=1 Tax=Kribbella sp. NPDC050820 TaxID=3155408 RepID=UPI0033DCCDA8
MSAWTTIAVPTRWLEPTDDLTLALAEHLPALSSDDTIVISEKVAVLLSGGAVPIASLGVGALARFLAGRVRPRSGSQGLSVPAKMQYVVQTQGRVRISLAVLCAGFTRPLGHKGMFYRVAGNLARDLDGARPPYDDVLIPPMPPYQAVELCRRLEARFQAGVAIVDINDFGGSIRATSSRSLPPADLLRILGGNPLGQRRTGTPFGVVRRATADLVAGSNETSPVPSLGGSGPSGHPSSC